MLPGLLSTWQLLHVQNNYTIQPTNLLLYVVSNVWSPKQVFTIFLTSPSPPSKNNVVIFNKGYNCGWVKGNYSQRSSKLSVLSWYWDREIGLVLSPHWDSGGKSLSLLFIYFILSLSLLPSKWFWFYHSFVIFLYNELRHTHKLEMELRTCVNRVCWKIGKLTFWYVW